MWWWQLKYLFILAANILENLNNLPDYVQQPASIELGTNQEIEKL